MTKRYGFYGVFGSEIVFRPSILENFPVFSLFNREFRQRRVRPRLRPPPLFYRQLSLSEAVAARIPSFCAPFEMKLLTRF